MVKVPVIVMLRLWREEAADGGTESNRSNRDKMCTSLFFLIEGLDNDITGDFFLYIAGDVFQLLLYAVAGDQTIRLPSFFNR